MDKFSEIQEIGIRKYLETLVVFKDFDDICLDVTEIVGGQIGLPVGRSKYYLFPCNKKDYMNMVRGNLNIDNVNENVAIKTIANDFYKEIIHYRANKFAFDYFSIKVFNKENESTYTYSNTDMVVSKTIDFIIKNGLVYAEAHADWLRPKVFFRTEMKYDVMQYKGYNMNAIKEWVKHATDIIIDTYHDVRGCTLLCTIGQSKKPVYLMLDNYIIKLSERKFMVLPKSLFEALFDDTPHEDKTIYTYFYGSDVSFNTDITQEEIFAMNKGFVPAKEGTKFNIDVPAGKTRILIAYPATIRDIDKIFRVDYFDGDVKSVFRKSIVNVKLKMDSEPVPYKVYTYVPGQPFPSDMKFEITL